MIELKKLFIHNDDICIEIKNEDLEEFNKWLNTNQCLPVNTVVKNNNDSLYVKIDLSLNCELIGYKTEDMWLYLFEDLKKDIVVSYHNNYAFLEENPYIPNDKTYLRYGLEGVVIPKFNKPGLINKLFKGYNDNNEWNTPVIFYKGNGEESKELIRRFGTYDLSTKNKKAVVLAYGGDVVDNKTAIKISSDLYCYQYRWIYENGMPRILEYNECFDSVLIPGNKHQIPLRIIIPDSFIETGIIINEEEFTRVYIFNEEHKQMIIRYCLIKHIEKIIMTENIDYPGNEYGQYLNLINNEYTSKYKITYDKSLNNKYLFIDISKRHIVGHIMFMILSAYANAHPELNELKKGRDFTFKI